MRSGGLDGMASLSGAFRDMDVEDERYMDVLAASPERLAIPSNHPFLAPHFERQPHLLICLLWWFFCHMEKYAFCDEPLILRLPE